MKLPAPLIIVEDQRFLQHDTGGDEHPECPTRLQVIRQTLEASDCCSSLAFLAPQTAKRKYLTLAHSENWLFRFEESVLAGQTCIDHSDNQICYDSYDIACLAAGAGITAIDLIEEGRGDNIFCLVRPPGHHAEHSMPFGFCFFNNCVVAARYWQEKFGKSRILIFDFDAHHGNGIQSAFEEEADTYYISIHEHPSFSYPGTGYGDEHGIGEGKGSILNLPLQPGGDDGKVMNLLENVIPKKLAEWQPDAIIIAAGFDAHIADDMSGLHYSTNLYYKTGKEIKTWADQYTDGKLLSILEGGYELSVLGESVEAYVRGILGK
ncbi:MAG TPA: histone deacetylase [Desulfocapsa sulfexigens]|nr:histone deacetylase [Desulfocapsa sulfexigens]